MIVKDVERAVNSIAPFESACDWDNCGLLCGDVNTQVTGVFVCLDADSNALKAALRHGCNVVVSHHPVVYEPLRRVLPDSAAYDFVRNGIAVISAHTCLDMAEGGINDVLAELLELKSIRPLGEFGRMGKRPQCGILEFIDMAKSKLHVAAAGYVGEGPVENVAVVGGSGGSSVYELEENGCDTLLTGEAKHGHFVFARSHGKNLITLGHFETENIIVPVLAAKLRQMLLGISVEISDETELIKRR